MKFQLPSFIDFIVMAVGMIGRVGQVNFNVMFSLSLVLSSDPPDETLCQEVAFGVLQTRVYFDIYFFLFYI